MLRRCHEDVPYERLHDVFNNMSFYRRVNEVWFGRETSRTDYTLMNRSFRCCVHWNCSSPVKFCIIRLKPVPIYLLWILFSSPITTNFLRICALLNGVFKVTIMYHFVLFFVHIFFFSLAVIKYTRFFVFDIIIDC